MVRFVDGMFATMYGTLLSLIDEQGITFVYITFSGKLVLIRSIIFLQFLLVVHYADRD